MANKGQKTGMFLLRAQVPGSLNTELRKLSRDTGVAFSKLVQMALEQFVKDEVQVSVTKREHHGLITGTGI